MGSIWNKKNWNNVSKHLFGSYSHSGIPGFSFRLFCSQEQNSQNIFQNIFRNIPNERALTHTFCSKDLSFKWPINLCFQKISLPTLRWVIENLTGEDVSKAKCVNGKWEPRLQFKPKQTLCGCSVDILWNNTLGVGAKCDELYHLDMVY